MVTGGLTESGVGGGRWVHSKMRTGTGGNLDKGGSVGFRKGREGIVGFPTGNSAAGWAPSHLVLADLTGFVGKGDERSVGWMELKGS